MASRRITAALRDSILKQVLDEAFAEDMEKLEALKEARVAAEETMKQHAWEAAFSKRDRDLLAKLPEGWLSTSHHVSVSVEDEHGVQSVTGVNFGCERAVPECFRYSSRVTNIVKTTHPWFKAKEHHDEARKEASDFENDLKVRRREQAARVLAVINSVSTVSRLVEVWPEVAPYIPTEQAGYVTGLPAVVISDLNSELGLPKGEAA